MKNYCIGSRLYVVLEALNTSHLSDLTKYATLPFCHRFFAFTVVVLHTFFITSHNRHSTCLGFNHMTRNLIIWIHLAVFKRFEMTAWVTSKDSPNSSTYLSEKKLLLLLLLWSFQRMFKILGQWNQIGDDGGHHFSDRQNRLRILRSQFARWSALFRFSLGLLHILEPCFGDGRERWRKLLRIVFKQRQTPLWSGITFAFIVRSEQTLHPWKLIHWTFLAIS